MPVTRVTETYRRHTVGGTLISLCMNAQPGWRIQIDRGFPRRRYLADNGANIYVDKVECRNAEPGMSESNTRRTDYPN